MATAEKVPMIQQVRVELESMQSQFSRVLPEQIPPEKFTRVVMTAIQTTPKLLECTRQSLWNACMRAATDGLLPDGREGAIVPYADKDEEGGGGGSKVASWMPMIAGIRKKARQSGDVATWEAHCVYERDAFDYELGDDPFIRHKPALTNRGKIIAAYSIATLKDGSKSREVMAIDEIMAVRSKSKARRGPWNDPVFVPEMCKKVVARRHSKVLPSSSDLVEFWQRDDETSGLERLADGSGEVVSLPGGQRPSLRGALTQLAAPQDRVPQDGDGEDVPGDEAGDTVEAETVEAAGNGNDTVSAAASEPKNGKTVKVPDAETEAEAFIQFITKKLNAVKKGGTARDEIDTILETYLPPDVSGKMFPPDRDELGRIIAHHKKRTDPS